MRRLVLLLLPLLAAPAAGQPPRTFAGGFGGVSADQFQRSNAALAAAQLAAELNAVRAEVGRSQAAPPVKNELNRLAGEAVRRADDLRKLAGRGGSRDQLIAADRACDEAADALLAALGRGVIPSPGLADAVARARYADAQLHAAIGGGGGGGGGWDAGRVARLAGRVAEQAEQLREVLGEGGADRTLDRGVRAFGSRVDRVRRAADDNNPGRAADEYRQAAAAWQAVARPLAALAAARPSVRLQVARVDRQFQALGEAVGGVAPAPPPGPGPVPPPGPGFLARGAIAVGAGEGGGPRVRVVAPVPGPAGTTFEQVADFFAFDAEFRGGVRVAMADVNGDGTPDLVAAPGPGGPPVVRVFDGRTMRLAAEFLAYDPSWTGGIFVAAADATPRSAGVIVTGTDAGGGPHVKVFDALAGREVAGFFAYADAFRGGVRVAAADVDGDGVPDVITAPGRDHDPLVRVFSGTTRRPIADHYVFDRRWTGGVWVAAADLTGNGRCELVVGPDVGGPPRVRVLEARTGRQLGELEAFPAGYRGGVRVACHDADGDGVPDVVCGPGPDPAVALPVRLFGGRDRRPLGEFAPLDPGFTGGVSVGAK